MTDFTPDVIIVGSGVGGGTSAWALVQRGYKVLVLEKGGPASPTDFLSYDEVHFAEHAALTPLSDVDPNIYIDANGNQRRVKRWWVNNAVGGSSNIWESNLIRYSGPDFRPASTLGAPLDGADMPDWPWSYEDFEPYYEKAEHDWGVAGKTGQSPAQETFREGYEYPMLPIRRHPGDDTLKEIFEGAGLFPYQGPKGINSILHDSRPPCPFCGFCQGFGCAIEDRASSRNTVLKKALDSGLCWLQTNCYVTRISHANGKVDGVYYLSEPGGNEQRINANRVIVATQADQSARLFLYSGIADPYRLVGRYLTYHTKGSLEVVFPTISSWSRDGRDNTQKITRSGLGTLQIRDLYDINDEASSLSIGGKFSVYDPYTVGTPISLAKRTQLWGKDLVHRLQLLRKHAGAGFSFTGIAVSQYHNRVELDPDIKDSWGVPVVRSFYEHHPYDLELSRYALDYLKNILEASGAEVISYRPQGRNNAGYGHMHGTLRAGIDPEESVLDTNCQSHTTRGLYALDASWMPTSGASNPSLTIMANVYRVCAEMT